MNGTVECWGENDQGQLGLGTTERAYAPTPVAGITDALEVTAGNDFTCVRRASGTVLCWGDNSNLQLGRSPTAADSSLPVPIPGLSDVVQLEAGALFVCALRADRTTWCWGDNANLQLGRGGTSTTDSELPTLVMGLANVQSIATGSDHACARLMDNTVRCWGDNDNGQLGVGGASTMDVSAPGTASMIADVVSISAGQNHTCAVNTTGQLYCWGLNSQGQLGINSTTTQRAPTLVTMLSNVTSVGAGSTHTCATITGGALRCWGNGADGQLGNNSVSDALVPQTVMLPRPARAPHGGDSHSCALLADDTLWCWGRGEEGQLGVDPRRQLAFVPTVMFPGRAVSGASGTIFRGHSCARLADDTVACWGNNDNGQLGNSVLAPRATPSIVPGLAMVRSVSLGINHSCALLVDGTARCWGDGLDGALGDGMTTDSSAPVTVMGLASASSVVVGGDSACAIIAGNQVRCWGDNDNGQLGIGTVTDSPVAAAVITGLTGVVELAGGADHFCARLTDGTVRCWGDNDNGQLGIGSTTDSNVPTPAITGLANVVQLVATQNSSCARLMDGTVRCWGDNFYGQLGIGSTTDATVPTAVPGLANVVDLAAGNNYVCARLMDDTIRCWGYNEEGNLGHGTLVNETSPVTMNAPAGVTAILAGNSATCVIAAGGVVHCVGWVGYGQLGNGQSLRWVVPMPVR